MTAAGPAALARAVQARAEDLAGALFTQATVTAVGGNYVDVTLPGSADPQRVPTLRACPALAVGNTVWLTGPPGSWVCIGPIGAPGGAGGGGAQGPAGVSVTNATINGAGRLILTLSSGATIDAGVAVGPAGAAGAQGAPGPAAAAIAGPYSPASIASTALAAGPRSIANGVVPDPGFLWRPMCFAELEIRSDINGSRPALWVRSGAATGTTYARGSGVDGANVWSMAQAVPRGGPTIAAGASASERTFHLAVQNDYGGGWIQTTDLNAAMAVYVVPV